MALSLVTPPAVLPLTLDELKLHLRVDDDQTTDDAQIMALLRGALEKVDGREAWINRALITQTWDLTLDAFPTRGGSDCPFYVPLAPLQSVTSITYTDPAGAVQTFASAKYAVDAKNEPGRIMPVVGERWPATRDTLNAVTVRYVAGFGDKPADVPELIREGVKLWVQAHYDRDTREFDALITAANALWFPYKVFRF